MTLRMHEGMKRLQLGQRPCTSLAKGRVRHFASRIRQLHSMTRSVIRPRSMSQSIIQPRVIRLRCCEVLFDLVWDKARMDHETNLKWTLDSTSSLSSTNSRVGKPTFSHDHGYSSSIISYRSSHRSSIIAYHSVLFYIKYPHALLRIIGPRGTIVKITA